MILENGMLLYHGSYAPVKVIDLSMCAAGKDFGRGFYLTEDREQARKFIKNSLKKAYKTGKVEKSQNFGYVSVFRYIAPEDSIPAYSFVTANQDWLWFVSMNRRHELADFFGNALDSEILQAEIISGKIANDTTNPTIMAYLSGVFGDFMSDRAVKFAIGQLLPERLNNQYCFLSERAVSCLKLIEVKRYEQ